MEPQGLQETGASLRLRKGLGNSFNYSIDELPDAAAARGFNTMLYTVLLILALPVMALIALLAYVFGYNAGKKVGIKIARREAEAWRDRIYCGTGQATIESVSGDLYK